MRWIIVLFVISKISYGQPIGANAGSETFNAQVKADQPLIANAGSKTIAYYPIDEIIIESVIDNSLAKGLSFKWEQVSGPDKLFIKNENTASCSVINPTPGLYRLRLTVKDAFGRESFDETELVVNRKPSCSAGYDKVIMLPSSEIVLNGEGIDIDGDSLSYSWKKVSGPQAVIENKNSKSVKVSGLKQGKYKFVLNVADDYYFVCKDAVTVEVKSEK